MTSASQPDQKLAELLLIVAEALSDEPAAGAVKVNKICWYAEGAHMRATGEPITGAEYHRIAQGPGPRRLKPVRDQLVRAGRAVVKREEFAGYVQHRLVPLDKPNWAIFSATEVKAIRDTLAELRSHTGSALTDRSHDEAAWNCYDDKETIPLVWAFAAETQPGARAREHEEQLARRYGDA